MAVAFLLWYFAYVLLADYAAGFMSIKVWGKHQHRAHHGPSSVCFHLRHHGLVRQLLQPETGPHRAEIRHEIEGHEFDQSGNRVDGAAKWRGTRFL